MADPQSMADFANQLGQQASTPTIPQLEQPQQQQEEDPVDSILKQEFQRYQNANSPQASGGPVKRLLQNFIGSMGHGLLPPTQSPEFERQRALGNIVNLQNAKALTQLRGQQMDLARINAMAAQQQQGLIGLEDATAIGHPEWAGRMTHRDALMLKSKEIPAQAAQGPMVNTTPEMQGLGLGPQAPLKQVGTAQTVLDKQNKPEPTATSKVDPIIAAQIGLPPDPAKFPAQAKEWGIKAETIKNRMAAVQGEARGLGFGKGRYGGYITPEGDLVTASAGDAAAKGYIPAAPGFQSMSKQAQFGEMNSASGNLRSSITALQPRDAFSAAQVAQMQLAMRAPDEGVMHSILNNLMASGLNERQQDYVIWLGQMNERILSLRNIAGMGQGASDLRAAIQATLPNVASGNKQLALKRLDAVDNQITQLYKGIPKNPVSNPQFKVPAGAPSAPREDGHYLKMDGKRIAVSKGGQWAALP